MCEKSSGYSYRCSHCSTRVGGCNDPEDLCKCNWCDCYSSFKDRKHELDRIKQFKKKARDDQHFKQLIFNRASKCGEAKREKFVQTLKRVGRVDLASFVEMTFKARADKSS